MPDQNYFFKIHLDTLVSVSCKVPPALTGHLSLPHCCWASTLSIFSMKLFPQRHWLLFFLLNELSPAAQTGPRAIWGLRAPDQAAPHLSLLPTSRYEGATCTSSHTPALPLSYFILLTILVCQAKEQLSAEDPVFNLWPCQASSAGSTRRSHMDLMWTQLRVLHLSIIWVYIHMESNPHTYLFTSSVLPVFCQFYLYFLCAKTPTSPRIHQGSLSSRVSFIYFISLQKTLIVMLSTALFNSNRTLRD